MDAVNMDWTQCNPSNHMTWDFELLGYAPTEEGTLLLLDMGHNVIVAKEGYWEVHRKYGHLICITTFQNENPEPIQCNCDTEPSNP